MTKNLRLLSLNVRGIGEYTKRKKIFKFLYDKNVDIIYLQETHSTVDTEVLLKHQIKGNVYFSHNSCIVLYCIY